MCNSLSKSTATSFTANGLIEIVTTKTVEKPSEYINLRALGSTSVSSLKASDPFMYYSIPTLKNAAMLSKEVDLSSCQVRGLLEHSSMDINRSDEESSPLVRRTRISTECHPGLIFQQYNMDDDDETDDEDDSDDFYDFLAAEVAVKQQTFPAASA
jgi:hypothetical protein